MKNIIIFITCLLFFIKPCFAINQLTADIIKYYGKKNLIIGQGHVNLYYQGNHASCDKVIYDKNKETIIATGNVTLKDKNNNVIHSDRINISKNLNSVSVDKIDIDTIQNTYFKAQNARKIPNKDITIFNNASYSACRSCNTDQQTTSQQQKPQKSAKDQDILWQIQAKRIIWDNKNKTISFQKAHFDFLNHSIIKLPDFTIADYNIKRYSGFLAPKLNYTQYLGYGITIPYFLNLNPAYDLTFGLTNYSRQGIAACAKWRQALQNGNFSLYLFAIKQAEKSAFPSNNIDSDLAFRAIFTSKGEFIINKNWHYGWDIIKQSDADFARSYNIKNYNNYNQTSKIYLIGLKKKNYFSLNLYNFNTQNQAKNPLFEQSAYWVLPEIQYNIIKDNVFGGQLEFNNNLRFIKHNKEASSKNLYKEKHKNRAFTSNINLNLELIWKRNLITKSGLVITPLLGGKVGFIKEYQPQQANAQNYNLLTAGLEIKYPLVIMQNNSQHNIEPIIQLIFRNNVKNPQNFININEDSKSISFNALSLFLPNKFSGIDLIEYGSRANLGLRYLGNINNYWNIYFIGGQSFQLSRENPFANFSSYFCNMNSLNKPRSDYVSYLNINHEDDFGISWHSTLNHKSLKFNYNSIEFYKNWQNLNLSTYYINIAKNQLPNNNSVEQQLINQANILVKNHWNISLLHDIDLTNKTLLKLGAGLEYKTDCLCAGLNFMHNFYPKQNQHNNNFNFHLTLRSLMDLEN